MNLIQKIGLIAGAGALASLAYVSQVTIPKIDKDAVRNYKWVREMPVENGEGLNAVAIKVRNQEPIVETKGYGLIADEIARLNGTKNGRLSGAPLLVPDYDGLPKEGLISREKIEPSYSSK